MKYDTNDPISNYQIRYEYLHGYITHMCQSNYTTLFNWLYESKANMKDLMLKVAKYSIRIFENDNGDHIATSMITGKTWNLSEGTSTGYGRSLFKPVLLEEFAHVLSFYMPNSRINMLMSKR